MEKDAAMETDTGSTLSGPGSVHARSASGTVDNGRPTLEETTTGERGAVTEDGEAGGRGEKE